MKAQGYGFIEHFHEENGKLLAFGWLLRPQGAFDRFEAQLADGSRVPVEILVRQDLVQAFPHVPHAENGGFRAEVPLAGLGTGERLEFHVLGLDGRETAGSMYVGYHRSAAPQEYPPANVMKRASGQSITQFWRATGIKNAHDMLQPLASHTDLNRIGHLLEWGCGSGRLTTHMIDLLPGTAISGTDIDAEAVEWAGAHLKGTFRPCKTEPPLPFGNSEFDAVVSLSVMSHLTRPYQELWLKELKRVMKPGGLLSVSTHGRFAGEWLLRDDSQRLLRSGFYDELGDAALEHVASSKYYRATFQTYEFTKPFWGKHFEVLDFLEGGMSNLQDIYVLRNPKA